LAQPDVQTDLIDPTLVTRARRYEREAVASLFDRGMDGLYRMCMALTGEEAAAEEVAEAGQRKALDALPGYDGDAASFQVLALRHAAQAAARRRPRPGGPRKPLAKLSNFDYELVSLRILGEISIDHLSPVLNAQPASLRAWLVTALREAGGRSGTGWGQDLRVLDEATDAVLAGESPEKAVERVSWPDDAEKLLETVAEIHGLLGEPIPSEVATRLRTSILAAVAERRALWVLRHHAPVATVPGMEHRHYTSPAGTAFALFVAAMLAVVVGAIVAVTTSFAGPESNLYPLKRLGESALIAVNVDSVNRADLEVKLAQARDREAEDMASRGDGNSTVAAVSTRFELLRGAGHDLIAAPNHDARWKAARDRYFKESDVQLTAILKDLQVTGQTRSAQDVQQLVAAYEADRKPLETQLGRQPASQAPATPPEPTPQPTPS
jgi:hypothetical protein